MASYKELSLIKDNIEGVVRSNLEGSELDISAIRLGKSYKFKFKDDTKPAVLNILEDTNGKVTLFYGQGKNPDFSKKIADKIIETCTYVELPFNQLVLGSINDKDFNFLIEYMSSISTLESERDISNGKQFKYKGRQGDTISINRYNNKHLHIQGRPSLLFTELIEPLSIVYPKNDFIVNLCGYFNVEVNQSEIDTEYNTLNPNAKKLVNDNLQSLLQASLAIRKVYIEGICDYSYITFPVFKGLEGVIKDIFNNHGIIIDNKGFICFDLNQVNGKHQLKPEYAAKISNAAIETIINKLYNYYIRTRHRIFHYDILLPQTIEYAEALEIVSETIETIEESCAQII